MESSAYNDYSMTNAQVGDALFLHKNTISEIEKRALAKVRKMFEERGIRAEDILVD
jgi:hypothetical protein